MVTELQNATADSQVTPAINSYQPTAALTTQQPVIDLLSAFHH